VTAGRLITIPNSKMLAESVSNTNAGELSCPVMAHI
jgi:small-conductance mechanosensitive channel